MMPERVEMSLLVLQQFSEARGTVWMPGDRAPLHRRAVRQAALERPELFAMEYETEPVDLAWLADLDSRYEKEFQEAKRARDEREADRQRALREELKIQERGQPALERRLEQQEKERAEREKKARDEWERRMIEGDLVFQHGSGFH